MLRVSKSEYIGCIPGPIGSLFAIAPTHIIEWKFCRPIMHLDFYGCIEEVGTLTRNVPLLCQPSLTTKPSFCLPFHKTCPGAGL